MAYKQVRNFPIVSSWDYTNFIQKIITKSYYELIVYIKEVQKFWLKAQAIDSATWSKVFTTEWIYSLPYWSGEIDPWSFTIVQPTIADIEQSYPAYIEYDNIDWTTDFVCYITFIPNDIVNWIK